jgi:uncharacterized membrane protein
MRQFAVKRRLLDRLPFWLRAAVQDRYLWSLVIVALFVNLGLVAFLLLLQNQLPPLIALHFDAAGQPDRIEAKSAIFTLPQIGLIMIVLNFVVGAVTYRREPFTSYALGGVAIVVQFLLWFAAISVVRAVIS